MYLLTDNIDDDVKLKLVELRQASMQLFEYAPYGHKWSCASDSEGDSGAQNDGCDSALCSPQFVVLKRGDEQADNPGCPKLVTRPLFNLAQSTVTRYLSTMPE